MFEEMAHWVRCLLKSIRTWVQILSIHVKTKLLFSVAITLALRCRNSPVASVAKMSNSRSNSYLKKWGRELVEIERDILVRLWSNKCLHRLVNTCTHTCTHTKENIRTDTDIYIYTSTHTQHKSSHNKIGWRVSEEDTHDQLLSSSHLCAHKTSKVMVLINRSECVHLQFSTELYMYIYTCVHMYLISNIM